MNFAAKLIHDVNWRPWQPPRRTSQLPRSWLQIRQR